MQVITSDFQLYLESFTRLAADKVQAMMAQARLYFAYCQENALDAQSDFTARLYCTQISEATALQDAKQVLLIWAEYHRLYLSPDMEARLGFSRPGSVGIKGTLSFGAGRTDIEDYRQISLFTDWEEYEACLEEWMASGKAFARAMRGRGFSWKTQAAYLGSLWRFNKFLPPCTRLGNISSEDVDRHLDHMLHHQKLSASSIRISTFGLKFWFQNILHLPPAEAFRHPMPAMPRKPPVVFSQSEVKAFLAQAEGKMHLLFSLLYGCGMRLGEGLALRVKDIDFDNRWILVLDSKGHKGRHVPLPEKLIEPLQAHIGQMNEAYDRDSRRGIHPWLPESRLRSGAVESNYRLWQWLFPSEGTMDVEGCAGKFRWHLDDSVAQRAFQVALFRTAIQKCASPHTLRHSFATHMIQNRVDIKTLQSLLGHSHINTTAKYLHVFIEGPTVRSPLDF